MPASDTDTIVAVATAQGTGGIGIVRLSGPSAVSIADRCYAGSRPLADAEPRVLNYGRIRDESQDLDQVLASVMYGPRSFTGEDTVEFNCHGGPFLLNKVVHALLSAGARLAEAGEFTRRAYLNGKIDLTQAEAVADMVSARSDASLDSAFFRLRGHLKARFLLLADSLRSARALLEADLDFSEDVEVDSAEVETALHDVHAQVLKEISGYKGGKLYREGARIALCGRPNVGKSSLLNCLLGEDRAIVSDLPGTTRDTVEEAFRLGNLHAHLIDTAGIRRTDDPVEREGARRARVSIEQADYTLFVVDGSEEPAQEDADLADTLIDCQPLIVLNKMDVGAHPAWSQFCPQTERISISALTGEEVVELRARLHERILQSRSGGADSITHERHFDALKRTEAALVRARTAISEDQPREFVAFEVGEALDSLGEIVGVTTPQDVLDRIFSTFCIGK